MIFKHTMLVLQLSCSVPLTIDHHERQTILNHTNRMSHGKLCLPVCYPVSTGKYLPMFLRSVVPSSSGSSTLLGLLDPDDEGTIIFF